MALLGKISAVVTANTTDFTRKIGDMKSELNDLNRKVQGYRLNLDTAALDKTLTKLQLFRRTLQEAIGKKIDVGPLQDLYKVFEDIGKPLTKVKGQIESLSNSTQAYLYPALERAQKGFQNLFREIQAGGTTFEASRGRIESLTRQIERLKASTAVVSDFSKLTGSLSAESVGATFVQPRALEELKKFIALREKASQLPAASREDPFFQRLVADASSAAERIEALVARIERAKLKAALAEGVIARDIAKGRAPSAAATASLIAATEQQRKSQAQLDKETADQALRNQQISDRTTLGAIGALKQQPVDQAEKAASAAIKAINALRAAKPGGGFESFVNDLIQAGAAAESVVDDITKLGVALDALNAKAAAGSRLGAAQEGLNQINRSAERRVGKLKTDDTRRREILEEARAAGVDREEITGARRRNFLANEIGGRAEKLQKAISGLDSTAAKDLQVRLDAATASLIKLVNTDGTPLQSEINKIRKEIAGLEGDAEAAGKISKLLNQFDSSTAMNIQPRAIKDYINDFQLLNNLAGSLNEDMGTRFGESLQKSRNKVRGLYDELAQVPRTPAGNAQAEKILQQIRAESRALAAELAALDPTRFSERQLNKLLSANRRLRGDIAGMRGAAMTGQLALQQLTFAVDDFFSSTGGFEYKLRAISNNISQFGFILGGTYGLIAGVAATVGTQLLLQFAGLGRASKEAEGALQFMNNELAKSRNLAEQNTKVFEDLAKAIRAAASPGQRGDIEQRIRDLRAEQKKAREADVAGRDPAAAAAGGRVEALEKELEGATRIGDRVRIRAELEAARRAARAAREAAMDPRSLGQVQGLMEQSRQFEIQALADRPRTERESSRLEELRRERIGRPANAQEAVRQIEARLKELNESQRRTPFEVRLIADLLPDSFEPTGGAVQAFTETDRLIGELDSELARYQKIVREGADNIAAEFAEQAMATKEEISGVLRDLSSLRVDADIRERLAAQFDGPAAAFGEAVRKIEERLKDDPTADITDLKDEAKAAAGSLEELYRQADKLKSDVALGALIPTDRMLSDASSIAGAAGGPSLAATRAAEFADELRKAEERRKRAEIRGDDASVAAIDRTIEGIRNFAERITEAAVAVAAFQRAAEQAAINLSKTLVGEAQSNAEQMRRRANRLANDPLMARGAAADLAAAEARRRAEEDSNRQLENDIARERIKFGREQEAGRGGRVSDLARQVREGRAAQGSFALTPEAQQAGKEQADKAQAELDRLFEARLEPFRRAANERDTNRQAEIEKIRKANEQDASRFNMSRDLLGDNTRMADGLDGEAVRAAVGLAKAMEEAKRRVDDAAAAGVRIPDELKNELERLADEIGKQRQDFLNRSIDAAKAKGSGFQAQTSRATNELERAGVFASDIQGQITDLSMRRSALEQERNAAREQGRGDDAARIQEQINLLDTFADGLNQAAIAVAAFQQAANRVALELQNTVVSEARGAADSARRRANEMEGLFGADAPQTREAREAQGRRDRASREAEDEAARARSAIAQERVKFEEEMKTGRNPAAAARAEKIRQLEEDAANEKKSAAEREAAAAEASRLRLEQEREFQSRPEVERERRRADEADAKAAEMNAADRGRELMKTEQQRRREELAAKAADIGARVDQMRREGAAPQQIRNDVQQAATNLAREAAPLLAGFADEVANARLTGPSRAALNASDVQTAEGARELNRLLRGDDPAKDVNLVELRKQVQLLEAIEEAIRRETRVVVDL